MPVTVPIHVSAVSSCEIIFPDGALTKTVTFISSLGAESIPKTVTRFKSLSSLCPQQPVKEIAISNVIISKAVYFFMSTNLEVKTLIKKESPAFK